MDFSNFKAPFLAKEDIWKEADDFRQRYSSQLTLPIDIHEIIEFDLDLEIRPIPSLSEAADIDALLLGDLRTIVIDLNDYMNDRMQNRLRFTLAHEIDHLQLHAQIYKEISHTSIADWIEFVETMPEDQYKWIEFQAYEFAGRFLVPPDILEKEFKNKILIAEQAGFVNWDSTGETALEFISGPIGRKFGVSSQVISRRLKIEGLWPL